MKQAIRKNIKEAHNISSEEPFYTLLIDGNSVMKRSLANTRLGENGKNYGMIEQSIKFIEKVLLDRNFSHCYFFMDGEGSGQLRAYLYEEYKANRDKHYFKEPISDYDKEIDKYVRNCIAYHNKKRSEKETVRGETDDEAFERQKPILVAILENLFVRTMEHKDVEGDDLIAYYVKHKKPNEKIYIISGDRDITQLIADDVAVYILDKGVYVSKKNDKEVLGIPSENIVLQKMICGDSSDNIKGIKGVGETTLRKLFPEIMARPMTLNDIMSQAKEINEQRTKEKKKPLLACTNIVDKVTDGIQGERIYEINKQIIDLSEPLLTKEAKQELDENMDSPLDPTDRNFTNIYGIIQEYKISFLYNENKFGNLFGCFGRLIENEKNLFKKC